MSSGNSAKKPRCSGSRRACWGLLPPPAPDDERLVLVEVTK
jgi:hypothetical protein